MVKTKLIGGFPFVQYTKETVPETEMIQKSCEFFNWMDKRRTIRDFSDRQVPQTVIEQLILTASTAPSGAHKQPWIFCAVSDPAIKKQIREAAEQEEYESYHQRMPEEWLADLRPLQTDWKKPFLETAPWLIVVFRKSYELKPDGSRGQVYYANESCGLACGILLTAIHHAGLCALTHTPSPMQFLKEILQRPDNEKPFLLIPVGYAAAACWVPDIHRKLLSEICTFY
ncbi:MAG: nitroreductase family protein [Chitinophagaceae bacterium]|nr:nitroreductase family protein [Chitinophagaceae bacterium]